MRKPFTVAGFLRTCHSLPFAICLMLEHRDIFGSDVLCAEGRGVGRSYFLLIGVLL